MPESLVDTNELVLFRLSKKNMAVKFYVFFHNYYCKEIHCRKSKMRGASEKTSRNLLSKESAKREK